MTGDKPLPRIPPLWVPLAELARWLRKMHGLTASEIRDVVVDLRRWPTHFRVLDGSAEEDENLTSWNDLEVDWGAGRARWKQCPDSSYFPLVVLWDAVKDAVNRLRKQQERLALPAPAVAAGEPQTNAANAGKPPFDARIGLALLKAIRDSGHWPDAPKEDVTCDNLLQIFSGVSNGPHREIRREVWPDMRRGRRTKQRPGGLTDKKR